MSYQRITWKDAPSTETPLSAANLNTIEDALDELYNEHIINVDTSGTSGSGIIARFGPACMMALTFVNPVAIGGTTDILQFPEGFKPYLDFTAIAFDDNNNPLGFVSYNAATNILKFTTGSQDGGIFKVSCTYITDVTPNNP